MQKQRYFLKKQKQKIFNNKIFNIEEFERLENLEKIIEIKKLVFFVILLDKFFESNCFLLKTLAILEDFLRIIRIVE